MKIIRYGMVFMLLMALCLGTGQFNAAAAVSAETEDWDNENAIIVEIRSDYVDQVLQDISDSFTSLDLKAVYISDKDIGGEVSQHQLVLRLVLKGGKSEQKAAVSLLQKDSRVIRAYASSDAPFETVNTLHLTKSADTLKVGETLTIKPEGELKIYKPLLADSLTVMLVDYDMNKEYTLADFPQFDFASVEKLGFNDNSRAYFSLKLAQPGYYNVCKAVNALALDPAIESVSMPSVAIPAVACLSGWKISDLSVVNFVDSEGNIVDDNRVSLIQDDRTIKGLKPGKVTITFVQSMGYYLASDYPVTCEITVTEEGPVIIGEPQLPEASESPKIPEASKKPKAPKTGDSDIAIWITLIMLAAGTITVLKMVQIRSKSFN